MTVSKFTLDSQGRPTLPPIHTLNLPLLSRPKHTHVKYQNHDNLVRLCYLLSHRSDLSNAVLFPLRDARHSMPLMTTIMAVKSQPLLHKRVRRAPFRRPHPQAMPIPR